MRNIGNELFSHLINLNFLIDIMLELFVGILQRSDGILQAVGQRVHAASENTDLILRVILIGNIKIQSGHFFGKGRQFHNWFGNAVGDKTHQNTAKDQHDQAHPGGKTVGQYHALLNAGQRHGHDEHSPVV